MGNIHQCLQVKNTYDTLGHGGSHVTDVGDTPTFKIDDLNLNECNLIHLDIEGFEKFAMLGAIQTLVRCKPVLCIEDFEPWKKRYNSSLMEIEEILFSIGYKRVGQVEGDTDKIYKYIE